MSFTASSRSVPSSSCSNSLPKPKLPRTFGIDDRDAELVQEVGAPPLEPRALARVRAVRAAVDVDDDGARPGEPRRRTVQHAGDLEAVEALPLHDLRLRQRLRIERRRSRSSSSARRRRSSRSPSRRRRSVRNDRTVKATSAPPFRHCGGSSSWPAGSFGARRSAPVTASSSSTRLDVVLSKTTASVRPSGDSEKRSTPSPSFVTGVHLPGSTLGAPDASRLTLAVAESRRRPCRRACTAAAPSSPCRRRSTASSRRS